ncbi:LysR family transcriptional regulator [Parasedimentitalea marina]|uniref:LysR family transcriptional regulator n=1 Tax=Parasedimentitalea marina TaxID=2483033 RepID=A0A3T0N1Z0_9RHOB|nr:LysR family transcriptional regulator [Parasedimentitalea marina]AZV78002.1 LysR family transcriptional regulator [Parasedimentitalea marina]
MRLPLATLEVFNAIAQEGSLSAAAQVLGIKRSTVSHQLKNLEERIGTALFIRTTRSISLTEAGRVLVQSSSPAFEQLTNGLENARTAGQSTRGRLKLAMPEFVYHLLISKLLVAFQELYPEIEIELILTDALSDILKEGLHAGFRLGGLIAQDMIAISLTNPMKSAVVASPAYLKKHGTPEHPFDLLEHNCIHYRFQSSGQLAPWVFSGPDGEYPVEVRGSLIANSLPVANDLAVQGLGIGYTFREYCADALGSGQLKEILTEHRVSMPSVNIYFPQEYRSLVPLRLFIQHLKQGLAGASSQ